MPDIGGPELIIILVVVLLVFGSSQLPKLARSLGQAKQEFAQGLKEGSEGVADDKQADAKKADTKPAATVAPADAKPGATAATSEAKPDDVP